MSSMSLISIKYKKAAFIAAFLFSTSLQAAPGETYKDIIEKAYNLSLQKDRTQSVAILLSALKRESKKSSAQKELSMALDQVAKVFYGDKSQQLFELALSLKTTDPALAVSKFQEAARLEPDNVSIELALARMSLSTGGCDSALNRLQKQKDIAVYVEEVRLAIAQSQVCLGKFEDYLLLRGDADIKKSPLALSWQMVETEYLFKTGSFVKARDLVSSLQKANSNFPEIHYWLWKSAVEMKIKADGSGPKYLTACKGLNSRLTRQFLQEPQLCRRITEVETFLKKNNNSEI